MSDWWDVPTVGTLKKASVKKKDVIDFGAELQLWNVRVVAQMMGVSERVLAAWCRGMGVPYMQRQPGVNDWYLPRWDFVLAMRACLRLGNRPFVMPGEREGKAPDGYNTVGDIGPLSAQDVEAIARECVVARYMTMGTDFGAAMKIASEAWKNQMEMLRREVEYRRQEVERAAETMTVSEVREKAYEMAKRKVLEKTEPIGGVEKDH